MSTATSGPVSAWICPKALRWQVTFQLLEFQLRMGLTSRERSTSRKQSLLRELKPSLNRLQRWPAQWPRLRRRVRYFNRRSTDERQLPGRTPARCPAEFLGHRKDSGQSCPICARGPTMLVELALIAVLPVQ